jgi:hypothetical protein
MFAFIIFYFFITQINAVQVGMYSFGSNGNGELGISNTSVPKTYIITYLSSFYLNSLTLVNTQASKTSFIINQNTLYYWGLIFYKN